MSNKIVNDQSDVKNIGLSISCWLIKHSDSVNLQFIWYLQSC